MKKREKAVNRLLQAPVPKTLAGNCEKTKSSRVGYLIHFTVSLYDYNLYQYRFEMFVGYGQGRSPCSQRVLEVVV